MTKKLIRFDWAVKKLLRNKANFVILEGFLSELLFDNIRIEKILESESNQETDEDKFNRVDILTQNSKKELIIIEIQNTYESDYFHRMAYGASRALTENLALGQPYSEIKKVISVNIVYFDLGQGKDYVYKGLTTFEGLHKKDILQLSNKQKASFIKEKVSDIFPEYYIIKVNQFNNRAKDTLDEWVYFLKNSEVKDEFKAKGLDKAKEKLQYETLSYEEKKVYDRSVENLTIAKSVELTRQLEAEQRMKEIKLETEQRMKEAKLEAEQRMKEIKLEAEQKMKEAISETELKAKYINSIEIAKKLIKRNLSNEEIAEDTSLTIEQIEALRSEK
jgi:predicted transposase/invertase (TIGR01784 family)